MTSIISIAETLVVTVLVTGIYSLIRQDMTNRKRVEAQLEQQQEWLDVTLSNVSDGVLIINPQGNIILMNSMAETLTGWAKQSAIGCQSDAVLKMVNITTGDRIYIPFAEIVQKTTVHSAIATGIQHQNSSIIPINYRCTPIFGKDGSTLERLVIVIQDITTQKQAEVENQRILSKEKELNELKSSFITMMSHEVRTPLTIILTSVDLLQNYAAKISEAKKQRYFHQIRTAIAEMQELLNEILLVSHLESDTIQCQPELLQIDDMCSNLIEGIQIDIEHSHRILYRNHTPGQDIWVDKKLLQHILTNLLLNAVKYSVAGTSIYVDLTCQREQVLFQVRDEGIGIPEKDMPLIFTSFHRGSNVGDISGTGIGLTIVKTCVDLHGGHIEVISMVGKGTTFTVTLPLRNAN